MKSSSAYRECFGLQFGNNKALHRIASNSHTHPRVFTAVAGITIISIHAPEAVNLPPGVLA
jgi:hypothetical protein